MRNKKQISIGIIGGGASGMMAAITAAKQGARVTLLEGGDRVGRKILSTGNGKCNLGNENLSEKEYNGAAPGWIHTCLTEFDVQAAKAFFAEAGLMLKEKNGYLYPYAEQAAVVLDVFRRELARAGVEVVTECKVRELRCGSRRDRSSESDGISGIGIKEKREFTVIADEQTLHFDRVILACGGQAAPKTGSDGSGYELARRLGHDIVPVVPALVQRVFFERSGGSAGRSRTADRVGWRAHSGTGRTAIDGLWDFRYTGVPAQPKGELHIKKHG